MPKKIISGEESELEQIFSIIKQTLKSRKITYREFSHDLNISESGLKKILSSKDCSYLRLKQLVEALGLTLNDLLLELDSPQLSQAEFSLEQQQYFLDNPKSFYFYFKLVIERRNIDEIQDIMKLSDTQVFSHLKQLDSLRLIKLLPQNKIKLPQLDRIRTFGDGPLLRKLYQKWALATVKELATPAAQEESKFIIRCLRVRDETFDEFTQRLHELDSDLLIRGVRDMAFTSSNKLKPMRWLSFSDQTSMIDASENIL